MDESKGRREARHLKLEITGTIGIFIVAKEKGLIKSFTEVIDLINKTDFRVSESLILEAKRRCGE